MRYHKDRIKSPSTFVVIDFEGLSTKEDEPLGIIDIGIAVLPSTTANTTAIKKPIPGTSRVQQLQTFFKPNTIECHWIRLKGKRPISGTKDTCHFANLWEIELGQTEKELVALFKSIQQRFDSPLVLVIFDLVFDFQFFSSWADLQDIVIEISDTKKSHGLRGTLLCGRKSGHNPADDTIRELAVLVNLLRLPDGTTLHVGPRPKREQNGLRSRNIFAWRLCLGVSSKSRRTQSFY
ncbi:hypothetical protein F4678DRAFT_471771 [Xylaria arbuscula]|nr:hypothetical protein F4678DRAFT_471771 [Xylaria arbuscula]